MYILLSGTPPFNGRDDRDILRKVKSGKYGFDDPVWANVSKEAKKLIKRMMEIDQTKRCSAQDALIDPWFDKVLDAEVINKPLARDNLARLKTFGVKMSFLLMITVVNSLKVNYRKLLGSFWCLISLPRKKRRNFFRLSGLWMLTKTDN